MIKEIILLIETVILLLVATATNVFKVLSAKFKKNGILAIIDHGNFIEETVVEKRGWFVYDKRGRRVWIITSPSHIKFDPKLKVRRVYLNSTRALSLNPELCLLVQKAWEDRIDAGTGENFMEEFIDHWEEIETEKGEVVRVPVFKEEIQVSGISVSQDHVRELIKGYSPQGLFERIQSEATAMFKAMSFGFEPKTFITVFLAIVIGIAVGYYLIKSGSTPNIAGMIESAVKKYVTTNATKTIPNNASVIVG